MSTKHTTAIVLWQQASDTRAKYAGAQPELENELGGALRIAAALRASHYPNTGAALPDLLESVEAPSGRLVSHLRTARAAAAAADQSLREELLTNDSLGG